MSEMARISIELTFGNFWLAIQNTTNRHVSNAFFRARWHHESRQSSNFDV